MKHTFLILVAMIITSAGCGRPIPRDELGNPIFKSRPLTSFNLTNCTVDVHYYTVANNITNRGSAFFVADDPTPQQVIQFATETPAFFFVVHRSRVVSVTFPHLLDQI